MAIAAACAIAAFTNSSAARGVGLPAPTVIVHAQPPYADPIALHAIACPSAELCVAVDDAGNVLTAKGPSSASWRVKNVDGNADLTSVSCASMSLCVATDKAGDVAVSTTPTRGTRAWRVRRADQATNGFKAPYPTSYLTSVSCPTTSLCVGVDNRGNVVTSANPAANASHWTTANVDGANAFAGISCASASFCAAVDLAGNLVTSSNPAGGPGAWRLEPLPDARLSPPFPARLTGDFLSAISCPSEALCVATTSAGDVLSSREPGVGVSTWAVAPADPLGGLASVSCSTVNYCAAVDTHGDALTTTDPGEPGAWHLTPVGEGRLFSGVACAVAEQCAAVDQSGNVVALAGESGWQVQLGVDEPRSSPCFGAAARALGRLCRETFAHTVLPTPSEAEITPNAPCVVIERIDLAGVCSFGVRASAATATVALLGDSHAQHWRAALEVVAQARNWQGVSVSQAGCPFSAGPLTVTGQALIYCRRMMMHDVIVWLRSQPEIETVFVSESELSVPHSRGDLSTDVRGYLRAWEALPASVRHIVVIRDTPRANGSTLSCVEAALAAHRRFPGKLCALPRRAALGVDPAAIAAVAAHTARVQVVDLTPFICGRFCYPVVGGALVYKDFQHLSEVFSATLGAYLGDDIARLAAGWRE